MSNKEGREARYFIFCFLALSGVLLVTAWRTGALFQFDGRIFFITAERLINGEWGSLYVPVPGSGPWAYPPQAAAFFAIFSTLGPGIGYRIYHLFSAAVFALTVVIHIHAFSPVGLRVPALLAAAAFWFVVWEGLFIGQVDLILLSALLTSLLFLQRGRDLAAGAALGFCLSFKPQFALFFIPLLLHRRYRAIFGAAGLALSAYLLLYLFSPEPWTLAVKHLLSYRNVTTSIVESAVGPVNQSLQSVSEMLFTDRSYEGRFDPLWYSGGVLLYKIVALPGEAVRAAVWLIRICCFIVLVWAIKRRASYSHALVYSWAVIFSSLPIISPIFWQVHMVYQMPVIIFLVSALGRGSLALKAGVAALVLTIALSNPIITGGHYADRLHSYGTYFICVTASFLMLVIRDLKSETWDRDLVPPSSPSI